MARELPFKDLESMIHRHRETALNVMTNQYMLAKAMKIKPGSEYVQEEIYKEFCEKVTDTELSVLTNLFYHVNIQRDKYLKEYVFGQEYKDSKAGMGDKGPIGGVVGYLKGMKGNENLEIAHFVQTMARDTKTGIVFTRTEEVKKYYSEKDIDMMFKNEANNFVPEFIRPNKEKASLNDIEILSVSNVTGLYDSKKVDVKKNLFDNLEYEVYSRVKTSEREMKKFVDWLLGLRLKTDYPYDAIALRIVVPDHKRKCGDSGEQMYKCKEYIEKKYKKYGEVIYKNLNTEAENLDAKVIKLNKDKYDKKNFSNVILAMRKMYTELKRKVKGDSSYELTKDQQETMLQYMQIKHYVLDDRAEIQIMNKEMHSHYIGVFVGHTDKYIDRRNREREEALDDPSKSDARKDMEKREKRTIKNKNRTMTKEQRIEQMCDADTAQETALPSEPEPSLRIAARFVENRYRPVFTGVHQINAA